MESYVYIPNLVPIFFIHSLIMRLYFYQSDDRRHIGFWRYCIYISIF